MDTTDNEYDSGSEEEVEGGLRIETRDYGKVSYTERFNADKLKYIVENAEQYRPLFGEIDPKYDPFVIARKYLERSNKGTLVVEYCQPRPGVGRFYAKWGVSQQGFKRGLRHAIGGEFYIDIDIVNAHPVILRHMCEDFKISCPLLTEYTENRGKVMRKMANATGVEQGVIKKIVLCLLNGGEGDFLQLEKEVKAAGKRVPKWLQNFRRESRRILDRVAELHDEDFVAHKEELEKKGVRRNFKASFNSLLMCNHENDLLMSIAEFFDQRGKVNGNAVLCFDGVQLLKEGFDGAEEIEGLMRECEEHLIEECGMSVKLKVKPMDEGFPVPLTEGATVPRHVDAPWRGLTFDKKDEGNVFRSDTGLAEIFVRYAKGDIVCGTDDGDAHVWSEEHRLWERMGYKLVVNQVSPLLDQCLLWFIAKTEGEIEAAETRKKEAPKEGNTRDGIAAKIKALQKKTGTLKKIHQRVLGSAGSASIFAKARSGLMDPLFEDRMNVSPYELPTRGGMVVNMEKGECRPRTCRDRWSYELDVAFLEGVVDFSEVGGFIDPVFCHNPELIGYMQKQLGACLTGALLRVMFIWFGDGRNGKSSLAKMLGSMLTRCTRGRGTGYEALSKEIFIKDPRAMKGGKSSHTAHLMPLKGLRCGVSSELDDREMLDTQMVRLITGGDDISGRSLNKGQETFVTSAKTIVPCNAKPLVDASLQAIVDRLVYVPFNARFVSPDSTEEKVSPADFRYAARPEFAPDQIADHPMRDAFFTWLVMGVGRYCLEGMKPPAIVRDFKGASLAESDTFLQFIGEECVVDSKETIAAKQGDPAYRKEWCVTHMDLRQAYDRYRDGDANSELGSIQFGKKCAGLGVVVGRSNVGKKYVGMKLKRGRR